MNKDETTPSKHYLLQSLPDHFYTGHLKDNTQVFMSFDYPNLVMVLFDPEGQYLRTLKRKISLPRQADINEVWEELYHWAEELGFVEGVISVKKFSLPEDKLGVQDQPSIYQEFFDSGEDLPEDVQEEIQSWKEHNDYVLFWYQDYDIDREGNVVST